MFHVLEYCYFIQFKLNTYIIFQIICPFIFSSITEKKKWINNFKQFSLNKKNKKKNHIHIRILTLDLIK